MAHPTEKNTGPWKKKMLFRAADGSIMTGTRPWDNTVVKLRIGIRNRDGKVARVAPNNWTPGANTRFEQLHGAAKVSSGT